MSTQPAVETWSRANWPSACALYGLAAAKENITGTRERGVKPQTTRNDHFQLLHCSPPLFMASRSEPIKAYTLPLRGMSGDPGRKAVTASLADGNKEAFDHLQSQDSMHYSALRVHEHVRPNVCWMPNR